MDSKITVTLVVMLIVALLIITASVLSFSKPGKKVAEYLTTDNLFYYGMPKLSEPVYDGE